MYVRRSEAITRVRRFPRMFAALIAASALLAAPAARAAFLPLPATGAQVNDDPANSIDPALDGGRLGRRRWRRHGRKGPGAVGDLRAEGRR